MFCGHDFAICRTSTIHIPYNDDTPLVLTSQVIKNTTHVYCLFLDVRGGINDSDQLTGMYIDDSETLQGFIANPVPEPASLFLLLGGLPGLLALRRRKRRTPSLGSD